MFINASIYSVRYRLGFATWRHPVVQVSGDLMVLRVGEPIGPGQATQPTSPCVDPTLYCKFLQKRGVIWSFGNYPCQVHFVIRVVFNIHCIIQVCKLNLSSKHYFN